VDTIQARRRAKRMSAKFRKILCPVAFEQYSAAALRFAGELAGSNGRLYVLHVIPAVVRLEPSTLDLARESLEEFAREHQAGDVKPELLVRSGDPAEVIVTAANELVVDVIVMATRGHKGLARLLFGSVAERIIREARPPVLTVRPQIAVQPKSA
jgi:universal stress protein A